MERMSRAELLSTIDSQRDQLHQYKAKLRDIVSAYKSITKEKDALEASVAALTNSSSSPSDGVVRNESQGSDQNDQETCSNQSDTNVQECKDEVSSLRSQLKTLSSSLTTLTQEKNKIEANFIADKKQLKQEIEDLHLKLADEKKGISAQAEGYELQIMDLKSRLRTQQLERETEQTDHALMLKELQMLLSKERTKKEELMNQIEETNKLWKEREEKWKQTPVLSEVYEQQIQSLQKELKSVRDHMKTAEIKANQPSPFVIKLQHEMETLKETHQRQVTQEQKKAAESEVKLQSHAKQSEERVSSLETKLSELSQTIGNYERLKFQDQQSISKLRERVTQLDLENTALVHAANLSYGNTESQDGHFSVNEIVDKIMHLREVLITASEKSEKPVKMSSIFVKDLNKSDEESSICKQYKNELENLKEEFEKYKLRAQSVLKAKNKDNFQTVETDLLKEQNSELRNKLRMATLHHQEEITQLQKKVDSLSKALLAKDDNMKMEFLQLKSSHSKEIGQLEQELKRQRERSLALLSEKDQEIQRLSEGRDIAIRSNYDSHLQHHAQGGNNVFGKGDKESEEMSAVDKLLSLPKDIENEAAFFHYAQEKARSEVEISTLRKQKRDMEISFREHIALAEQKENELKEEINLLKERNAENERQSYRGGANVEYLKNVLLKFLTSTDGEGKKKMLKALMTILQFSPQENQRVQQVYNNKGWWVS